jgi:sulfur carrier protein
MSDSIVVCINDVDQTLPAGSTLIDALRAVGVEPERTGIAVAMNLEVVRRPQWAATVIEAGAEIDIVTATQGG